MAGLTANGGNVERTARALGIPAKTLEQWAKGTRNPVPAQLSVQKRADLTETMEDFAHKLMGVSLERVGDLNIKDLGVTLGIVVDKLLLLKAQDKADAHERAEEQRRAECPAFDFDALYPHEIGTLGKIIDKLTHNPHIIYPPQPGDPDYDPGLPLSSDQPDNPEMGVDKPMETWTESAGA